MFRIPKIVVFASGTPAGGGSGARSLGDAQRKGLLNANIAAFVSNHENGGVRRHAEELGIPFLHFRGPYDFGEYARIVRWFGAEFVALSGWLKLVVGLDPKTTFNIHPGPLPRFGGKGMYGHHVHEAVLAAFKEGTLEQSAVSMHFVTDQYDQGPVFFHYEVPIFSDDTPTILGQRVNKDEHEFQATITDYVVRGLISWNGKDRDSLRVPLHYPFLPKALKGVLAS